MHIYNRFPWLNIKRAPDDGGTGGGDGANGEGKAGENGAPAKGDGAGDGAGGGKSGADGSLIDLDNKAPPTGERPAYIPEAAWDATAKALKKDAADVLAKELETATNRADGLRKELGKGKQNPPAKAEDYKLPDFVKDEKDKPLQELFKADDPLVKGLGPVFHKHGVSQAQYEGIMKDGGHLIAELAKDVKGGGEEKQLTEAELEEIRTAELAKIGPNGSRIAAAVSGHLKELISQGHFNTEEISELRAMASTASGLTVLNKMRALMGGESIPTGDSVSVDGLLSDGEIFGMMGTKEYQNSNDPGHAAMHQKVDRQLTLRQKAGRPERLAV